MTETENKTSPVTIIRDVNGTRIILRKPLYAYSFIAYELIRAFFFLLFAKKGFRSVSLKVKGRWLSAHCSCSEYLYVWQYVIVSLMPVIVLGLLPLCYSLFSGRFLFFLISIPFFLMGINDCKTIYILRYFEADHFVVNL